MKPITTKELFKYNAMKREWPSQNDAYNRDRYGMTYARYQEIDRAVYSAFGISNPKPSAGDLREINKAVRL